MTIRNLHPDPHCYKVRGTWHGQHEMVVDRYRYRLADDGATVGSLGAWEPFKPTQLAGKVLYTRIVDASQDLLDRLGIEGAATIIRQDGWIAARVADGSTGNHTLPLAHDPFILDEVAIYTPADWGQVFDLYRHGLLPRPFSTGDTLRI